MRRMSKTCTLIRHFHATSVKMGASPGNKAYHEWLSAQGAALFKAVTRRKPTAEELRYITGSLR